MSIQDMIEDISSSDPAPKVTAPTPARREGKDVLPLTEHMDDGVSESTALITRDIMGALAEDIKQLAHECSRFKDISSGDPAPKTIVALTQPWTECKDAVLLIKRQFGHVMSCKSYAQDIKKEVERLANETDRVHNAAEEARNNLRNVYDRVMVWQESAEKALKEAQTLLNNFEEGSKTCCYGTLPNPCFRYQFNKKAKDKIEDMQKLARKGCEFKDLDDISLIDPALGNVAAPNSARREGNEVVQSASTSSVSTLPKLSEDGIFESRAAIIRDIMGALADNGNSVVGIYGIGGVGKSTLLVDVERRIRGEKQFDMIAKADVSQNPDIKMIQGVIAHALGLDMKDHEYESVRADRLRERLGNEKKKVLIILDNLWQGLDLKSVGIPCGHDNKVIGCKLLLTSRDLEVLRRDMGCDRGFHLGALKEEEAKILFERMVGDKVHNDEFRPLVDEALRKCAGLPLLIVAMAKHLKRAPPPEWRDALNQIEWATNEGISGVINKMLQLSYDHLESEEAKNLLQLCVAYGVSKPCIENLVRYGYGLGIFRKGSKMNEARDRLSTLIRTLQASSLLLDSGDADGFKIHDLVRDFVAQFILRDQPLLVLKNEDMLATQLQTERLESCMAICFPYIDMKELPKELDCPELHIFLLFNNNAFLEVQDSYFNSMRKLAVLDLTRICLTRSPTPFQFLENLHTLSLQNCLLEDVAILGKLKGLQILSFVGSRIERLPKEIGQLVELRLLDLNHCSCLHIIEPGVLRSLIKLEELYMENSFNKWNAAEQTQPTSACLIELNHMKNLSTLYVCIPDPSMLLEDLNVKKLTKYGIQIGDRCWSSRKGLRTLELKLNPMWHILKKEFMRIALDRADDLYLDELNESEQSIRELFPEGFPNLKHLHVENSPSGHHIFRQVVFPSLETLHITGMHNIEMNWDNQVFLQHLKVLDVSHCYQLTNMFTLTIARNLVALTKLRISNCKMLMEVFSNEGGKEGHVVAFNRLKSMELDELIVLRCFSLGGSTLMFPLLEDVIVTKCLNMKFFSKGPIQAPKLKKVHVSIEAWFWKGHLNMTIQQMYEEMATFAGVEVMRLSKDPELIGKWHDEVLPIEPLLKLKSLVVDKCPSFINAIPSILMLALNNMRILQVCDCKLLEEIFDLEGLEGVESTQVLPQLWHLGLVDLPNLRRLWNKNLQARLHFNSLSHLTLYKCSNLRIAFAPSMIQCFAVLQYMEINKCGQIEGVIAKEEGHGSAVEKITFPNLWWMVLECLPNLTSFLLGKNHTLECPILKWLTIAHCPKMRSFSGQSLMEIDHGAHSLFTSQVAFPNLETLHITDIDNIKMIWDNQVAANSCSNLKSLCVQGCNRLKCIWDKELHHQVKFQCLRSIRIFRCKSLTSLCPASIAKDLIQLKELDIDGCGIVELIENDRLVLRFVFPNLTSLRLENLIELKGTYTGTHALHWPALKTLEVHGCNKVEILACQPNNEMPLHKQPLFLVEKDGFPNLETLYITHMNNIEMIWDNFQHLKTLDVSHCNGLPYMLTPTTAKNLVELVELRISNCEMLTEVISNEGDKEEHEGASDQWQNMELDWLTRFGCFAHKEGQGSAMKTIRFPNLLRVELECLPKLNSFLSGNNHTLEWPVLEELTIANCPKMTGIGTLFHRPPSFISSSYGLPSTPR